jgi:putative phosphonate metabolism protein
VTAGARYAIYFSPEPWTRLWRFGSSVIGFDAETGDDVAQIVIPGIDRQDVADRTSEPRQYGFHATLKPPFHLAEDQSVDRLLAAVHAFALDRTPFVVPALDVTAIGAFLALVPSEPSPELTALADACIREFDHFRAPLQPHDRERRLKSPLTERQIAYLDTWGYPYVFEEFRFHMTLTGRLHHDERDTFRNALIDLYRPIAEPLDVTGITVFQQPARDQRFTVLARIPLGAVERSLQDARHGLK